MEVDSGPSRKAEQLYKMDEQQLLAILPEEIWRVILGQLKNDPDAQSNCANASPYFWEMLKKDRLLFLFPKVMEIMAPRNEKQKFGMFLVTAKKKQQDYNEEEYQFRRRNYNKWWRSIILECRLVCSAWNKGVEHCYQSATMAGIPELSNGGMDPRSPVKRMARPWTFGHLKIESVWDVHYFIEKFQETHFSDISATAPSKNPIFGRWLVLNVTRGYHYKDEITTLLELCGKEIWYCCTSWYFHSWTSGEEFCSELAKWLGLMPNLRFLNMMGPGDVEDLSKNDFQVYPIPKLEKLQMLDLDEMNGLIASEMIRVNDHVKVLRLTDIDSDVDLEVGGLLNNLKDFSSMPSKSGDEMLVKFGHHWKQLSHLYLVHASKYFGELESNWSNSLVELELRDPFGKEKATILRESKDLRLKLPGIRRFSVWIDGLFYLDFMKPMEKCLEHLEIIGTEFQKISTKGDRERVKKEQSIELVGFEGRMQKSNVWKFFGKLETVKINLSKNHGEFHVFSKEGKKFKCKCEKE